MPELYLRIERPWGVLLTLGAAGLVAWRLATLSPRQSNARRMLVEACGMLATLLVGVSVAGLDAGKSLDRMTVLIALDRSRSIDLVPGVEERLRTELLVAENGMRDGDRIGTIAFAANAVTEDPPRAKSSLPAPQRVEIGRDGTDIGAAIRRALAEVPSDTAARIVLISDGVSNRGDPVVATAAAVAAGVPIDTVVLDQREVENIRVVGVRMPSRANEGETLELHLVTASTSAAEVEVRVKRDGQLIAKSVAKIDAGQDVLRIRERAPESGLHRYDVEISATDAAHDQAPEDNAGSAFVRVRGPATALVLEAEAGKGEFIAQALRNANFVVTSGSASLMPGDIGDLAFYDVVFFSDIPAHALSSTQLDALAAYVRDLGGGLVLMGGDRSMGPGGYSQTPLEEVSPVSFDIKQDRRRASLAEVIIIDYSGSMGMRAGKHTKLELANEAAVRSANLLGEGDQLGVMHVDTVVDWTQRLGPVVDQAEIARRIRAVSPGGGGIYVDISLKAAYAALSPVKVNLKHVLLFADGDDAEQLDGCRALVSDALRRGITTSVVSLGKGSDVPELETLSRLGDGRFYLIEDAERLPAVFTQETILAARSALNEVDFRVTLGASGSPTRAIDFSRAPILKGYVVTIPKDRSSVVLTGPEGDPILATWSVGMGRSAAFTSDLKDRWGRYWTTWPGAASLVAQLARDVTRLADDPRVRLDADTSGGQLYVRAQVVDDHGRAQTFRRLMARVAGPDGISYAVALEPVGAGAYAATQPLSRPGTYVVTAIDESENKVVGTTGAVLTAGEELRPTGSDRAMLARISSMTGGKSRDTLAGVFADRSSVRFAYFSLTPWLTALGVSFLLFSVAARRLSVPTWIAEAPRTLLAGLRLAPGRVLDRLRISRRGNASPNVHPSNATHTMEQLGAAKERSRELTYQPAAQVPEYGRQIKAVVSPPTRDPSVAHAVRSAQPAQPVQPVQPTQISQQPREQSGSRQLTAAEILLQRRRGRQR
ncbi:MAG: VWA domain-containing protein [Polyangiaceae bacterium]|nr:VWA domain-containing protein [Polyangiaceae bacterium]